MPQAPHLSCKQGDDALGAGPCQHTPSAAVNGKNKDGRTSRKQKNGSAATRQNNMGPKTAPIYPRKIIKPPSGVDPKSNIDSVSPPLLPLNGTTITSPLLRALGSGSPGTNISFDALRTEEWARQIPPGKSPPNDAAQGLSVAGSSPPSWATDDRSPRAALGGCSASPGSAAFIPVSQKIPEYETIPQTKDRMRRTSAPSQTISLPPPPHLPQPHFYGAPDIDLGPSLNRPTELPAGSKMYHCSLDTIDLDTRTGVYSPETVILEGGEGMLRIIRVSGAEKLDPIGSICGLPGSVIGARILPRSYRVDPLSKKGPMVILILHGPVSYSENPSAENVDDEERPSDTGSIHSPLEMPRAKPAPKLAAPSTITHYQTTVEVYSIPTQDHITTLYKSPAVPIKIPLSDSNFSPPDPIGNLKIEANKDYIIVASGTSGEVYIFGANADHSIPFKCLGKTWTETQSYHRRAASVSSSSTDEYLLDETSQQSPRPAVPVFALNGHQLAVVPPPSSSQTMLNGNIPQALLGTVPPGLKSHAPSMQPQVTCSVLSQDTDSFLNRMPRQVTQDFLSGAQWVGEQGKQAWKQYWKKGQDPTTMKAVPTSYTSKKPVEMFPPTHGENTRTRVDPTIVSVLDLARLQHSHRLRPSTALNPVFTFQPPLGCSFLSFGPTGTTLMTASKNGDVHHVWDLMQAIHLRTSVAQDIVEKSRMEAGHHACVRQLARFARLTTSRVVDVKWSQPIGERIAVTTAKGTVHIFDIEPEALHWPPRRKERQYTPDNQSKAAGRALENPAVAQGNRFTSAFTMVSSKATPLLAAVRGRPQGFSQAFSGMTTSNLTHAGAVVSVKLGRAVASGLSKSVGAAADTVNTIRHVGENRLHLQSHGDLPRPGCVGWINNGKKDVIGLLSGGLFQLYGIHKSSFLRRSGHRRPAVMSGSAVEFELPAIPNARLPQTFRNVHEDGSEEILGIEPVSRGYWKPGPISRHSRVISNSTQVNTHPLSLAEIETSSPYQPFHANRRVSLAVYDTGPLGSRCSQEGPCTAMPLQSPMFGLPISVTRLETRTYDDVGEDGDVESHIRSEKLNNKETVQLSITSRRRKEEAQPADEDDIFEDDCEVVEYAC